LRISQFSITDAEREKSRAKREILAKAIDSDIAAEVVLTAADVNAWLQAESADNLKGAVVLDIREDRLSAQFSIPLREIPGFKGRYLNGSATLRAEVTNGVLEVYAADASFKGEPVPEWFMRDLRQKNLADRVYENPNVRDTLKHIDALEITGGRVVIRTTGE